MPTNHNLNLKLAIAAVAITMGVTSALADSLTMIAPLGTDTTSSGRAITPDGKYVVGGSGTAQGFFYNVATGVAVLPNGGGTIPSTAITGVGYRTYGGVQETVLSGVTSSGYANWMTTDGGLTWGAKRRDTSLGTSPWKVPAANGLAGTSSDIFYSTFFDSASSVNWRVGQMSGAWPMTPSWANKAISSGQGGSINGISSTGRSIGTRKNTSGGPNLSYYYDWVPSSGTPTGGAINGLDGTAKGQAWSINADGSTIFGFSPTLTDQVNNYGYKTTFSGTTQGSVAALPLFGDEVGSTSLQIPYGCSQDGNVAVGMAYRGTEKAVVWVTADPDPTKWYLFDLTTIAQSEGILDGFTRLSRAYSIGTDAAGDYVITGQGVWSPDGGVTLYTRGFVMTVVPEPGAISLLVLGGLLWLRRRK